LPLEELVQVVELRPQYVPMVVPGFGIENILVGQQCVEDLHDSGALLVGKADV
jgi:hypothetical protein